MTDDCDSCADTPADWPVDELGCPYMPGDMDDDFDVDQTDFGAFQRCMTGPDVVQSDPVCAPARIDADEDVDADDAGLFMGCMSGPDVAGDPTCAN